MQTQALISIFPVRRFGKGTKLLQENEFRRGNAVKEEYAWSKRQKDTKDANNNALGFDWKGSHVRSAKKVAVEKKEKTEQK